MSAGRAFLDTNIFVYLWAPASDPKTAISTRLVQSTMDSGQGCVSMQVVQEFFSVAFRKFPQTMTDDRARQFLALSFAAFEWVPGDSAVVSMALQLRDRNQLPWYDSLIVAAAMQAECSVLYSEDFQHNQQFDKLRVINPFLSGTS